MNGLRKWHQYDTFKSIIAIILVIVLLLLFFQANPFYPGPTPTLSVITTLPPSQEPDVSITPPLNPSPIVSITTLPPVSITTPPPNPEPEASVTTSPPDQEHVTPIKPDACANVSQPILQIGTTVKAKSVSGLNLNTEPGSGQLVNEKPIMQNTLLEIIDGPKCATIDNAPFQWWNVQLIYIDGKRVENGSKGWSIEDSLINPCANASQPTLKVGDIVKVNDKAGLNLRHVPGIPLPGSRSTTNGPANAKDTLLEIIGGPDCIPNGGTYYRWWNVQVIKNGREGWSAESYISGRDFMITVSPISTSTPAPSATLTVSPTLTPTRSP